jgi:hypothetical protein
MATGRGVAQNSGGRDSDSLNTQWAVTALSMTILWREDSADNLKVI